MKARATFEAGEETSGRVCQTDGCRAVVQSDCGARRHAEEIGEVAFQSDASSRIRRRRASAERARRLMPRRWGRDGGRHEQAPHAERRNHGKQRETRDCEEGNDTGKIIHDKTGQASGSTDGFNSQSAIFRIKRSSERIFSSWCGLSPKRGGADKCPYILIEHRFGCTGITRRRPISPYGPSPPFGQQYEAQLDRSSIF